MSDLLLGLGLVAVIEGLALALAPNRLKAVFELVQALPPERLRVAGLIATAFGTGLVWMARG